MSSLATLEQVVHGPLNEAASASSPGQENVAVLVRELFMRAREARRPMIQQWKRNYRVLNNRDYRQGSTPWEEEPAISNVWPVVASATAWMTDQRPTIEVTPSAVDFTEYWEFYLQLATHMNVCMNSAFQNYMLDAEINKGLWDVYTYGIAYYKTCWEPWLAEGLGDAVFRRCDPFTIYPDPHAQSEDQLTYIIEAKTMTVNDMERSWPGAKRKIAQAFYLEENDEAPNKLDSTVQRNAPRPVLGALAPSTRPDSTITSNRPDKPTDVPVVTVLEAYVRGTLIEASDEEGVSKVRDNWRCIVVCGNAVLMDEACEDMSAYATHPYSRQVLFDTGEWYGPCIVELLAPIQRLVNWLLGAINRNVYLMGNPVMIESPNAANRNKRITNRAGQRFTARPGEVGWLDPPQMHPQMSVDLIHYYEGKIETISGLSAMVRGFAPTGRNAQGVLDSVQDAAFVRVRASLRELERTLRSVAPRMAASIAEFYTEPRLMSLIGEDGRQTHLALQARHFYALDQDSPGERIPLRFSLTADAGSQLPTSKQARAAEAMELFKLHAIDIYELLKAIQWPNYAVAAQRIMEQNAQAAMAQEKK